VLLALAERLPAERLGAVRAALAPRPRYVYVTPGEVLVERALRGFPPEVRELAGRCRIIRTDARGGGGFYPDRNEIELAAGVETYEGLHQVELSACHELFHYVCWNHPLYRLDEDRDFAYLRRAVRDSRTVARGYRRYFEWVTTSFLRQGAHANPVEYFADIPTNFRDLSELPPPISAHFAPLIDGSSDVMDLARDPDWTMEDAYFSLETFQRHLAGTE